MNPPSDPTLAELGRSIERVERAVRDGNQHTSERLSKMVDRELFKETIGRVHERLDAHERAARDEETERKEALNAEAKARGDALRVISDKVDANQERLSSWVKWLGTVSVGLLAIIVTILTSTLR